MTKKLLLLVLLAVFIQLSPLPVRAQAPLAEKEWITDWLLLGPVPLEQSSNNAAFLPGFTNDFLKRYGGERHYKAAEGKKAKINGQALVWKKVTGTDSVINLDQAVSRESFVTAYAYTELNVPDSGIYILSLGTNDGGRCWLNGDLVWEHPGARGCLPDDDLIPVILRTGTNRIMLKIEEKGNRWEFCVRILPFDLSALTARKPLFRVAAFPDGRAELRCERETGVVQFLFPSVGISIRSQERDTPLWSGKWNGQRRMTLPLPRDTFGRYIMTLQGIRNDSIRWQDSIGFMAGKRVEHVLFSNNSSDYTIVVGKEASPSEKWAAEELQEYLYKTGNVHLPIVTDDSPLTGKELIVGYNEHTRKMLGKTVRKPDSTDESFFYRNAGPSIIFLGGSQRGTMYAVFTFLEKELGVRWYTPSVTVAPERDSYVFTGLYHAEKPTLQVRNDFYYEAFDPVWAAHNKINGAMGYRKQYGGIEGYWSVHTFYQLMPPSEFYKDHPEYYSLIDGKRVYDHAQLCLTNPDVLDIVTKRLEQVIRENPDNLIYSVSQNDWGNPCQCDKCRALAEREGSESGVIVWFVNQVAERIKKDFPDKYVGTLAYQYSRKPPAHIVPDTNVVIRLCSIECCFAHPLETGPENRSFMEDLKGWSAIARHLYIWDYVVNFSHYIMPYPNFAVLQPNLKTFIDNHAIGVMEQGDYQSRGGEFAELRAYLLAKLLWNVNRDPDEVIDDFMVGYYGRSGQYVRKYFDLLQGLVKPDTHIHLGLRPDDRIFTDRFVEQAEEIFRKAEKVADNDEIRHRVEMARLPVLYLKCKRDPVNAKYDGTLELFNRIVKREGITHFAEAGEPHRKAFYQTLEEAR